VSVRAERPWTVEQAARYDQLCADERKLLCGAAPTTAC
jgi:hypothetical protein